MKRFLQLTILLLFVSSSFAQNRVSLFDGRLSFDVPNGFRSMNRNEIASKFPSASPPQFVYANPQGGVSIAVTVSQQTVTLQQLPELKAAMEQMLPQMTPGLQWIKRETVGINGQPWVHFEMTSAAVDTKIHNHMYLTSFGGRMLGINMNSTVQEYPVVRNDLTKSRNSIRIKN